MASYHSSYNSLNTTLTLSPPNHCNTKNSHSTSSADLNDPPHIFTCSYCHRGFYNSQALGGHQNAHKFEKTLAKKSREKLSRVNVEVQNHGTGVDAGELVRRYHDGAGMAAYGGSLRHVEDSSKMDLSLRL